MAAPISFDEIIQAGRQKKKNEELANRILGKSKKTSPHSSDNSKNKSLASRVGVSKSSAPATKSTKRRNRTSSRSNKRRPHEGRLVAALEPSKGQAVIRNNDVGMTIRGSSESGPFVVIGSNFAPGTTAADIQSAVEAVSGPVLSCSVISPRPTVTAEMVFAEKWAAENVVANFHNQKADGRVLSIRLRQDGTGVSRDSDINNRSDAFSNTQFQQSSYDVLREQADRQRRNRKAGPELQDGRYGFDNNNRLLNDAQNRSRRSSAREGRNTKQNGQEIGLYSDQMMIDAPPQQTSRNRGRRQR